MKNSIYITTSFEGYHSWPQAPDEVDFLRLNHRHVFHVKVIIDVSGSREIEFFIFKRFIDYIIMSNNLNNRSCEQIGEQIIKGIHKKDIYQKRKIIVEISEDGENGAIVEYNP